MTERFEPAKTVFFDMDGVIAGFEAHAIHRVETMRPGFTADAPRAHFYIADDYPDYSDDFRYVSASPGFFRELPVLDGVFDAWQSTIDAGWQPRILSSPLRSNPTCEADKRSWLQTHFDPLFGPVSEEAIIAKEKHVYDGIALVDDRGDIPFAHQAPWSHIVVDYPHNIDADTDLRIQNIADPNLLAMIDIASHRYIRGLGRKAL